MKTELEKAARQVNLSELTARIMPDYKSLALTGFASLRKYSPTKNRFEGGESGQIKDKLKALFKDCVVEVKRTPEMDKYYGAAYAFSVTQVFKRKGAEKKELEKLLKTKIISEGEYPVSKTWLHKHSHDHACEEC